MKTSALDIAKFQKKKFECLTSEGELTQKVIQTVLSIIKNAMDAGQTHARVQTLFLSRHYTYNRVEPYASESIIIHDTTTFVPITHLKTRIVLASRAKEFMDWLTSLHLKVVCTSTCLENETFATHMHMVVLFTPILVDGRVAGIYNGIFLTKCLDDSMVPDWNSRCLAAINAGCTYFTICTMYLEVDYKKQKALDEMELVVKSPREYLTMRLLENRKWTLCNKFDVLVAWVKQLGYVWTLSAERDANWAYFIVLLEPCQQ
jgi:hypothetical protein